jgi:hypothetical protein
MIIELTNDKKTKAKTNNEILEAYQLWFYDNPNVLISGSNLELIVGFSSARLYINKLRCMGLPIVSNHKGYKYSTSQEEIVECYRRLRNRALIALTAANTMKKFI